MKMLDAPEPAEKMAEYADIMGKIDDCFGRIEILKREANAVKSRKLLELDKTEIARYDHVLGMLKDACVQVREELSKYEIKMKELDAYLEPGAPVMDERSSVGYNSPSKIRG